MRKNVFGRQFSRDTNQRKALFKSLISSLILDESIKTTLEKAKAIKGDVDKIVNKAKKGDNTLKVQLLQRSLGAEAMNKVIKDLAPRLSGRTSGYTRITKLGRRFSDNAPMVLMEWVEKPKVPQVEKVSKVSQGEKLATTEAQKKLETRKKRSAKK